jgi:hypothetical protein
MPVRAVCLAADPMLTCSTGAYSFVENAMDFGFDRLTIAPLPEPAEY